MDTKPISFTPMNPKIFGEPLTEAQFNRAIAAMNKAAKGLEGDYLFHPHDDGLPAHAVDGPSSSTQVILCPASVSMQKDNPSPESEWSYEGTVAHKVWELSDETGNSPYTYVGKVLEEPRDEDIKTIEVDYAMAEFVEQVMDYVDRECEGEVRLCENKVTLEFWVKGCFGSVDKIVIELGAMRKLKIIDLKYGAGVPVSASDTTQAACYGLGAVWALAKKYNPGEWDAIECHIAQPRLGAYTHATYSIKQLIGFGEYYRKRAKYARTKAGMADFNPSVKACQFCGAKEVCKARSEFYTKAHEEARSRIPDPPQEHFLKTEDYVDILPKTDGMVRFANSIERLARKRALKHDGEIPGYKVVEGMSFRSFKDESIQAQALAAAHVAAIAEGNEHDDTIYVEKPRVMLSPAQAQKRWGSKIYKEHIEPHVVSGGGAKTLVPESDPRAESKHKSINPLDYVE